MNCVDVERVNHPELVCPLQPYTCLGMEWLTQVGVVYYFSCVIKRFVWRRPNQNHLHLCMGNVN